MPGRCFKPNLHRRKILDMHFFNIVLAYLWIQLINIIMGCHYDIINDEKWKQGSNWADTLDDEIKDWRRNQVEFLICKVLMREIYVYLSWLFLKLNDCSCKGWLQGSTWDKMCTSIIIKVN